MPPPFPPPKIPCQLPWSLLRLGASFFSKMRSKKKWITSQITLLPFRTSRCTWQLSYVICSFMIYFLWIKPMLKFWYCSTSYKREICLHVAFHYLNDQTTFRGLHELFIYHKPLFLFIFLETQIWHKLACSNFVHSFFSYFSAQ